MPGVSAHVGPALMDSLPSSPIATYRGPFTERHATRLLWRAGLGPPPGHGPGAGGAGARRRRGLADPALRTRCALRCTAAQCPGPAASPAQRLGRRPFLAPWPEGPARDAG